MQSLKSYSSNKQPPQEQIIGIKLKCDEFCNTIKYSNFSWIYNQPTKPTITGILIFYFHINNVSKGT